MNKMIRFFRKGVKNMGQNQYFRVTGDCTLNQNYGN